MNQKKILVICGPTATGKTDLGISFAKKFNGEIVSCDSRQVYTGLDIGTGKLPKNPQGVKKGRGYWVIEGIPIYMYDVVSPEKRFSVAHYLEKVYPIIEDIEKREKLVILVGGTGLYLKGLISGFDQIDTPLSTKRSQLEKLSVTDLQNKLSALSPLSFKSLNNSDKNNPRRLIRKIELCLNQPLQKEVVIKKSLLSNHDVQKIGLTAPRSFLNKYIDDRVIKRIDQGMIQEASDLYHNGLSLKRMKELGLEYGLLAELIAGKINKKEFIKLLQTKIHQYAKRQMTWFRKDTNINWFDISEKNWKSKVDKLASNWYNHFDGTTY